MSDNQLYKAFLEAHSSLKANVEYIMCPINEEFILVRAPFKKLVLHRYEAALAEPIHGALYENLSHGE